jgi:hypothetical protein
LSTIYHRLLLCFCSSQCLREQQMTRRQLATCPRGEVVLAGPRNCPTCAAFLDGLRDPCGPKVPCFVGQVCVLGEGKCVKG